MRVPLARPSLDEREVNAVREVLASGWVVQGLKVEEFEKRLVELHGVAHAVAVASGTAALHVAYMALGIVRDDAVFIPSFAWPSAANVAHVMGARPVLVDVLPDTYNISPKALEEAISRVDREGRFRPRLVVPVHEFGLAADMDSVLEVAERYGLEVLEDAACALGAAYKGRRVCTLGACGILSFHPRKAITTGEGGAILTNDGDLARRCRVLRNHGQAPEGRFVFEAASLNYRMTEIQAAIGLVQLEKLPAIMRARREIAGAYLAELATVPGLQLPKNDPDHTWQTFMVVLEKGDRDDIVAKLAEEGIGSGPGAVSAHCTKFYAETYGYRPDDLPVSQELWEKGLALPVYEGLDGQGAKSVAGLFGGKVRTTASCRSPRHD